LSDFIAIFWQAVWHDALSPVSGLIRRNYTANIMPIWLISPKSLNNRSFEGIRAIAAIYREGNFRQNDLVHPVIWPSFEPQ